MKLTTITQVTLDGVVQGNGGASDEDRRNGFERGGWALGAGDDDTRTFIKETYQRAGPDCRSLVHPHTQRPVAEEH